MSRIAAIGEGTRVAGYALSGADVHAVSDPDEVRSAWARLPDDVGLVILTPDARSALGPRLSERSHLLWTVMPD